MELLYKLAIPPGGRKYYTIHMNIQMHANRDSYPSFKNFSHETGNKFICSDGQNFFLINIVVKTIKICICP